MIKMIQNKSPFLNEIKEMISPDLIHCHEGVVDLVGRKESFIEIFPGSVEDLHQVNRLLEKYQLKFHTISTGKNWGLGSNFPPLDVGVVINLSRLNQIIQYNPEFGFVEIQPGVTQEQLARFLVEQKSCWYMDVTGSGAQSSILGNSLARGISYNYFRVDRVMKLRVLQKNGKIEETGFKGDLPVCHLYRWGIGPDTSGLYFQSDQAIVLSGTFKLERKPDYLETFSISYDPRNAGKVCEAIAYLQQQEVIRCNVHLANFQRYYPVIASNMMMRTGLSEVEIKKFVARLTKLDHWLGTGVVFGHKKIVQARKKVIKQAFKGIADLKFVSDQKLKLARFIFKRSLKMISLLDIMAELRGFATGTPSDIAVSSLAMQGSLEDYSKNRNVDRGDWGAVFYSPVGPYSGVAIEEAIACTLETAGLSQFEAAITVNAPGGQIAEYVISLHYPKTSQNTERAIHCIESIRINLKKKGILPYRLGIWQAPE